jgi:YegS/Rv2252/BmrU family lipid kinase
LPFPKPLATGSVHIAIVLNPFAGSGRGLALSSRLVHFLKEKDISHTLFSDPWPTDFVGYTDVWIVGGDGTLNFFINKYPGIHLPLFIFPGGSGNDFHWMLYGDKPMEELIGIALTAPPTPVDAGICNDRLFLNSAGAGFDGVVVKSMIGKSKKKGKASFYKAVVRTIFSYREQQYSIQCDGRQWEERLLIVSVMNCKRAGGGFMIAPQATVWDGLLDITLIDPLNVLKRLLYLPTIEKGTHVNKSFVHQFQSKAIRINSKNPIHIQLDGEYICAHEMNISILPGKFLFRHL